MMRLDLLSIPPSEGEMSKRLGGIIGCKYKTSSWHLSGFPGINSNIAWVKTVKMSGEKPTVILYTYIINRHARTPDEKQKQNRINVVHHQTFGSIMSGRSPPLYYILYTYYINRHAEPTSITKQKTL